jgi:hypothetical protein
LHPGRGQFSQYLAVPFRLGLVGPTRTFLRELAEFFGGCCHSALPQPSARYLALDEAMAAIEVANPDLKGVLPKDYNRPALDR